MQKSFYTVVVVILLQPPLIYVHSVAMHGSRNKRKSTTVWVGADPDMNTGHISPGHTHSPPQPSAFALLNRVVDDNPSKRCKSYAN